MSNYVRMNYADVHEESRMNKVDVARDRRTAPSPVVAYVTKEVRRQGHDVTKPDGIKRVGWMLDAWRRAMQLHSAGMVISIECIELLGATIEQGINAGGFRKGNVRSGTTVINVAPDEIVPRLERLLRPMPSMSPLEFYREFELIHPFYDGNGRTGKILLNWRADTLVSPTFPPNDFWRHWIENP